MSRTISEIYNSMVTEKQSNAAMTVLLPAAGENATNLLSALSSGSKVAIWRLLFWVSATGIWFMENLFDLHMTEISALGETLITGTARWYWSKCLSFQYGDSLQYDLTTHRFEYTTINSANQIIKRAAVIDVSGLVKIKVAKLSAGLPVKLSSPELTSFSSYINLIKFAGTNVEIISLDSDKMKLFVTVKIDPLVLTTSGESIAASGTHPVRDAINNYIQSLPFNGVFSITELTDRIQAVSGVINPVVTGCFARTDIGTFSVVDPLAGYTPSAGHLSIDPAFPLSSSITYVS